MKTLNTLLTLSLVILGASSFANTDRIKSNVPAAPSVWESPLIEAPASLKYIKAKNAFVPVAAFELGDPSEVPTTLLTVPVAPIDYGNSNEEVPVHLGNIKAKFAFVPVAPFVWGDPSTETVELGIK